MVRLLILIVMFLAGCSGTPDEGKLRVLVTTNILADAVRTVAGDDLDVDALMGAGTDPHTYKARFSDIQRIERADLIIYNGLHLEGKLSEILDLMPGRAVPAAQVIAGERLIRAEDGVAADPHIWFDVSIWAEVVRGIGNTLAAFDPPNGPAFLDRANRYAASLDSLHRETSQIIATIPPQHRILITAHDAFGYFGRAYGLEVRGLQGISTVSEYGVHDVSALVDFVTEHQIPAVFVEAGIPARSVNSVIEGSARHGHRVREGGMLYTDALGAAGDAGGTYLGMIHHNVTTIATALGGKP